MFNVLVILIVIASLLMIGIVLIQKSKGGGLASNFASSNQIMGVRKTNSFVEKATWTLAVVICVLSILSAFFVSDNNAGALQSRVSNTEQTTPAKTAPFNTNAPASSEKPATETPSK